LWRTNSANAYSLTVSNGTGSGYFGAGSILNISANPAPSGYFFAGWSGFGVQNATASAAAPTMPTNDVTVAALYVPLPPPAFTFVKMLTATTNLLIKAQAFTNQVWILQASPDLYSWVDIATNTSDFTGFIQFIPHVNPAQSRQFYRLRSP
jgi:uncharacterized repeat protein (TIGR02543 family)